MENRMETDGMSNSCLRKSYRNSSKDEFLYNAKQETYGNNHKVIISLKNVSLRVIELVRGKSEKNC